MPLKQQHLPQANYTGLYTPKNRISIGNWVLTLTAIGALLAISIAFVFEHHFGLGLQIAAHITLIICSVTLKIGYLIRSFALKEIGQNQF